MARVKCNACGQVWEIEDEPDETCPYCNSADLIILADDLGIRGAESDGSER